MNKYLIAVEGLVEGMQVWVAANTEKEALDKVWNEILDDWQQSKTESLECIEVQPLPTMNETYGDGSDHPGCPVCGLCITCGDCAMFGHDRD